MAGNKDDVWVVDSGCTEYITHKSNLLENKNGTSNEAPVVTPNGHAIPVEGRGDFIMPGGAKINGVLYIPNFKHNLLFGFRTRSLIGSENFPFKNIAKSLDCKKDEPTKVHDDFKSTNFFLDIGEQNCFDGPPQNPSSTTTEDIGSEEENVTQHENDLFANNSPFWGQEIKEDHAISHEEPKPRSKMVRTQPAHLSEYVVNLPPSVTNSQPGSNQANSTVHPISRFVSYDKFFHSHKAFLMTISSNHKPSCFEQATQDEKWQNAMQQEIKALEKNGTWTLKELPEGKRPIDFKWVYKTKFKYNGEVKRYKARLVAKRCTQREGVYYHETFAPVAKLVTVQTLLVVATKKGWIIHQLDVNNAFLHEDLDEEVYMKIPKGFTKEGETRTGLGALLQDGPEQGNFFCLVAAPSLGKRRSRQSFLGLRQRQNIERWLPLLVKFFG
nr:reverse transcriptase, RNA-dependent DNA polymerase [Tanacetum cinerariifolium]